MTTDGSMPPIDVRYYYEDQDRHGNTRRYFRRRIPGSAKFRKVRLREKPDTPEFHEEFAAALAGRPFIRTGEKPPTPPPPKVVERSLRWLVQRYYKDSLEFRAYDEETKKVRRNILKSLCKEPVSEDDKREIGDLPCDMPEAAIVVMVRRKAESSINSANARLKAIRKLSEWAVAEKPPLMVKNVAKGIDLLKAPRTGGHHTFDVAEIEQYCERHPPGTKAWLALHLFLLFGQRISDVAKFGKQHIRRPDHVAAKLREIHPGRWLAFRQHKNRNRSPVDLVIPILPQLEEVLAISKQAGVLGDMTFLETEYGKPFTVKGLGNWFGDRCSEAKVPGRAHGLRKAGATISAQNGATPHQLMAIFGWKTLAQAELYTKAVQQQLMAGGAMNLLVFTPGGQP
ncbi:tyrosine-type recombinase/integrase [Bradyrhizobium uaiense]|uniref:Tyrosine-type recombinase/integrase n=1 Tax=Bradyrhizobium uaiense TaxID=2594946 RepID=A0A6P1B914_9BRAD|nr:tyrosine-type recombinase/integrase [Bradyrhizobium uaiense]NEU94784.1 tyrosine-type recombinase/integrase [Bradyrhizobium uaiense]